MLVLLVAATESEMVEPLLRRHTKTLQMSSIVTGVGISNAAYALTKAICVRRPALVIHLGICGAFKKDVAIGDVVHVHTEIFAEMGTTTADGRFSDLAEIGLPLFHSRKAPNYNVIQNQNRLDDHFLPSPPIRSGKAVTVNKVTGDLTSIREISEQWSPDFENMEGAAVAHVCTMESLPYFEFRAVSNYVEPRDISRWNIPLASKNIQAFVAELLKNVRA